MLAMCGRDLPTASAISCCVRPKRSISAWKPCASSIGLRSVRCTFSTMAISSTSTSLSSRTTAGIVCRPARCAARQRRSPATISNLPPCNRAHQDRLQHAVRADRVGEFVRVRLRRNACAAAADCAAPGRSGSSAARPRACAARRRSPARCGGGGCCGCALVTGSSNTLRGGSIGARCASACGFGAGQASARWPASAARCAPARQAKPRARAPVLVVSTRSLPFVSCQPRFGVLKTLVGNPCPAVKISYAQLTLPSVRARVRSVLSQA